MMMTAAVYSHNGWRAVSVSLPHLGKRPVELDKRDAEACQLVPNLIERRLGGAGQQAENNRNKGYQHGDDELDQIGPPLLLWASDRNGQTNTPDAPLPSRMRSRSPAAKDPVITLEASLRPRPRVTARFNYAVLISPK